MNTARQFATGATLILMVVTLPAMAMSCVGPDLANIAVLPNGQLEVHGNDRVARSSDKGLTWQTIPGLKPSIDPFWNRTFKDANGVLYQNLIVRTSTLSPIVIVSTDNGKTWDQKHWGSGGVNSLVVWADATGVYRFYADKGLYSESNKAINQGTLEAIHRGHEVVTTSKIDELEITYTTFKADDHPFLTFSFDGSDIKRIFSESSASEDVSKAITIGQYLTGFFITKDRTLYLSTSNTMVRGRNLGESWEKLNLPKGWMRCTGQPPQAPN
jgi:hypothetical protein